MDFIIPKKLGEALEALSANNDYKILAGGTDLVALMKSGVVDPKGVINIWGLDELSQINDVGDSIEIGALATHTHLAESDLVRKHIPMLSQACKTVGAKQIQNRGTIGGNVANASPAGDTLPVLLAYDAKIEVSSKNSSRRVSIQKFYKGYRDIDLKPDEIVTKIVVPKEKSGEKSAFLKVGTRKALAISKIMGAFKLSFADKTIDNISIAFGSVAAIPVRLRVTEQLLKGKSLSKDVLKEAVDKAKSEVNPIDDIRSTADYRRHVCGSLLNKFLRDYI